MFFYLNRMWKVETRGDGFVLTQVEDARPGQEGRTLLVTKAGVVECSRDGHAKPLTFGKRDEPAYLEQGSAVFDKISG